MKLLERLLANTGELIAAPYLKSFADRSPEKILKNSLKFLDPDALIQLKKYVKSCISESGGFIDRGGKADLYYSLFGYFISRAFGMEEIYPQTIKFTRQKIQSESLSDINLHCAAIINATTTPSGWGYPDGVAGFRSDVMQSVRNQLMQKKIYNAFLSLITCYYIKDYQGVYKIRKYLGHTKQNPDMPCTLTAAQLVLQKTFSKPAADLIRLLLSFYDDHGGFRATKTSKTTDLLSTAVALYALNFAGADLRLIRPACLDYIDSLHANGGFSANSFDPDTDIEYTFYGLLALGALAS